MKRYSYEISLSRSQFAEGYVIADNQGDAIAQIQGMIWDIDWNTDAPEIEIYHVGEEED